MKKVININFQGRVIPIEESAFDILKQYIESLRRYFAAEEGRDEIINDIESRIGELFSERLKTGATCVTDEDVHAVIASMGRPEDFEAQEGEVPPTAAAEPKTQQSYQRQTGRGPLYRNADDKIIAGVCSGLASFLGIDPIVTRIVFVLLFGALFWVYILLWIIVPSRSVQSSITKRLYRSADDKMIGGVAGGIAAYFNISTWVPRLIFALPFIIGLISGTFNAMWWEWDFAFVPRIVSGSLGSAMFFSYIILWIAVPVANTATEKLEMRGEKVDLNSIANTVKEDLEQFKVKAEKWGAEVKTTAQQFGKQASASFRPAPSEHGSGNRKSGIGHVLGVLIKAFLIFIFGTIAIALFFAFIGIVFGGIAFAPLKGFILGGPVENVLAWATLILLLIVPFVALLTWAIRRLMGVRSRRHSLGFTFLGLWITGIICGFVLAFMIARNFKRNSMLPEEQIALIQPERHLSIDVDTRDWKRYNHQFFGLEVDDDFPFYTKGDDSMMINTVRFSIAKSNDSAFHVYRVRGSRGRTSEVASEIAGRINFEPSQSDSSLLFPEGFFIGRNDRYRNQRVWIVVEVPVGKTVNFSHRISNYDWIDINTSRHNEHYYDEDWSTHESLHRPQPGKTYIMQENGRPKVIDTYRSDNKVVEL